MLPFDRATRNLLPQFEADPDELIAADDPLLGGPQASAGFAAPDTSSVRHSVPDAASPAFEATAYHGAVPSPGAAKSGASFTSVDEVELSERVQVDGASGPAAKFTPPEPPDGPARTVTQQTAVGDQGGSDPKSADGGDPAPSAEPPVEEDDSTQLVTVEQDASVFVRGYQGSVVTRLRFDQDVDLDQDFNLEFDTDGDGYFLVFIDQDMRIDEDLWIDLDIFDENNVLYVDLFMRDSVEVDQTTSVRIGTSDNGQGGSVVVEQSVDADQSFGLDIDIEDELEERYRISVDVAVLEQLYTDQDVDLDIVGQNREFDVDYDADQTVVVDHEAVIRIDFAVA
jgi:hypothetical protein